MRSFIQWWFGVFFITLVSLALFGMIPKKARELENKLYAALMNRNILAESEIVAPAEKIEPEVPLILTKAELPIRIQIPSARIDFRIVEPETNDIGTLDRSLIDGVVHYPESGLLGEDANMLLFGHSSNLKYVRNPAFKALTGIQKVASGDTVIVQSELRNYIYRITSIELVDKNQELVAFETGSAKLTISTCNTFGKKEERYVVKADFVESVVREELKHI